MLYGTHGSSGSLNDNLIGLLEQMLFGDKQRQESDGVKNLPRIIDEMLRVGQMSTSPYSSADFSTDAHTSRRLKTSRHHCSPKDIVIAQRRELEVLGAVNALDKFVAPDTAFYYVSYYADTDMLVALEREANVLFDIRKTSLFESVHPSTLSSLGMTFRGSVSSNIIRSVQKHQMCRLASGFCRKAAATIEHKDMSLVPLLEYSATDAQKILNALSGRDVLNIAFKKTKTVARWRLNVLEGVAFMPEGNDKACENTKTFLALDDVFEIWMSALSSETNRQLLDEFKLKDESVWTRPNQLASRLEGFFKTSGIESAISAWRSGVPVSDIVA